MDVVVADDQDEVRSALRLILEDQPGVRVLFEACRADELWPAVSGLRDAVVILDWELPGLRARETLRSLAATSPGLRVIAISGLPEARRAALEAGADAFVSKGDPPEELLRIVHTISGGHA